MASRLKRKRERGGASHPCPKCGSPSRVFDTRLNSKTKSVDRQRECLRKSCGHLFRTVEEKVA